MHDIAQPVVFAFTGMTFFWLFLGWMQKDQHWYLKLLFYMLGMFMLPVTTVFLRSVAVDAGYVNGETIIFDVLYWAELVAIMVTIVMYAIHFVSKFHEAVMEEKKELYGDV